MPWSPPHSGHWSWWRAGLTTPQPPPPPPDYYCPQQHLQSHAYLPLPWLGSPGLSGVPKLSPALRSYPSISPVGQSWPLFGLKRWLRAAKHWRLGVHWPTSSQRNYSLTASPPQPTDQACHAWLQQFTIVKPKTAAIDYLVFLQLIFKRILERPALYLHLCLSWFRCRPRRCS